MAEMTTVQPQAPAPAPAPAQGKPPLKKKGAQKKKMAKRLIALAVACLLYTSTAITATVARARQLTPKK